MSTSPGTSDSSLDMFMDFLPPNESTEIYPVYAADPRYPPDNAYSPENLGFESNYTYSPPTSIGTHPASQQLFPQRPRSYSPLSPLRQFSHWEPATSKPRNDWDLYQDDDNDDYETQHWIHEARISMTRTLRDTGYTYLLELCDTWLLFSSRYCFDPARIVDLSRSNIQRYLTSDSIKHGMLSTTALVQGHYNPKVIPAAMFKKAEDMASIAEQLTNLDLQRPEISLENKLAALGELICYHYYTGNLKQYDKYLRLSAPIVSILVGSVVEFHKLSGDSTFDIRFFSWCDILCAVALSRPTLVTYACDVEPLFRDNIAGRETYVDDAGLEWIAGCPEGLTMLIIQTINLLHSRIPQAEKIAQAARIEEIARAWVIRPSQAPSPLLRVERMAAQEIWRHGIILYIYNAIHKASPTNDVVRKSVKQVIELASTMRPGQNPDCLLLVPYFIAATFATTPKDRHLLRTRLAGIGNEAFVGGLVTTLDELWKEAGDTARLVDWSSKEVVF